MLQFTASGVIVTELGQKTIVSELDIHWLLYIFGLVPN